MNEPALALRDRRSVLEYINYQYQNYVSTNPCARLGSCIRYALYEPRYENAINHFGYGNDHELILFINDKQLSLF
jgi:hypothetical protein